MRKCRNCDWEGQTHMTAGQVVLTIILYLTIFPFSIIYSCAHKRKCPKCGGATDKIKEDRNEIQ